MIQHERAVKFDFHTGKGGPFKQILLDLYDPLGFGFRDMSAADKKKGLFAEINNGRMAMIGLFSVRRGVLFLLSTRGDGVRVRSALQPSTPRGATSVAATARR